MTFCFSEWTIAEILLKLELNTNQSINQSINHKKPYVQLFKNCTCKCICLCNASSDWKRQMFVKINYTIDAIKQYAHAETICPVNLKSKLIPIYQKCHQNGNNCSLCKDLPASVVIMRVHRLQRHHNAPDARCGNWINWFRFIVFNATFSNISAIWWRPF